MSRIDLLRYFTPVAGKLSAVEDELQLLLKSDLSVVKKLAEHVKAGQGKRLRPALVLLTTKFCGAETKEDVRFGAVFELLHTATLVHDDVIDHATLRRSKPTLNSVWGNTLTVLFGDLLYLQAMSSAIRGRNWRIMEILSDVTTRMIEGELIQNDCLYNLGTTRKEYFEIQERKTALLFGGCTEGAAVLAGRPEADCIALRTFGLEVGRAFQLVDDLLDYTATREQLGKPVLSDLLEGKLTLPMLSLLERAPKETEPIIRRIWETEKISDQDELQLRSLISKNEALSELRDLARQASQKATACMVRLNGETSIKKLLMDIPGILLERSK
jgi:octaprenyl-diphosphate synthase